MIMTTSEAITKYDFISKALLKSNCGELSKEMKVKVMIMRIDLSKIKKTFDEDRKEFINSIVTDEHRILATKVDKTDEEKQQLIDLEVKLNEEYNAYIDSRNKKEVDIVANLTDDEYNELMLVNLENDVVINQQSFSAGDYLEILYSLFVED